jgi:hypothetical protein
MRPKSLEQTLQTEIDESKKWLDRETEDSTYKRDLQKRIADKLHNELRILDWIFYQVCSNTST